MEDESIHTHSVAPGLRRIDNATVVVPTTEQRIAIALTERSASRWSTNNPCSERIQDVLMCLEKYGEEEFLSNCSPRMEAHRICMASYESRKIFERNKVLARHSVAGYNHLHWKSKYTEEFLQQQTEFTNIKQEK